MTFCSHQDIQRKKINARNSNGVIRRDFIKISANYGITSTLLDSGATLADLAITAAEAKKKRYAIDPKLST